MWGGGWGFNLFFVLISGITYDLGGWMGLILFDLLCEHLGRVGGNDFD